ncbi:MAG TPA: hypothetical protein VGO47_08270 [Chlamydiales bacterium]|jgi:hypothetical protein|nr:hypothetical protein [Chlamydiales bacterium]
MLEQGNAKGRWQMRQTDTQSVELKLMLIYSTVTIQMIQKGNIEQVE